QSIATMVQAQGRASITRRPARRAGLCAAGDVGGDFGAAFSVRAGAGGVPGRSNRGGRGEYFLVGPGRPFDPAGPDEVHVWSCSTARWQAAATKMPHAKEIRKMQVRYKLERR